MTDTTGTTDRPTKPIADVKPGDRIWHSGSIKEVRHVEPYGRYGDPLYLVVFAGGDRLDANADYDAQVATDDEIAEQGRAQVRKEMAAGLRELANLIERHALPVPHVMHLSNHLSSVAYVERIAEVLDLPVEPAQDDHPFTAVEWTWPANRGQYELPKVEARFAASVKPAPEAGAR